MKDLYQSIIRLVSSHSFGRAANTVKELTFSNLIDFYNEFIKLGYNKTISDTFNNKIENLLISNYKKSKKHKKSESLLFNSSDTNKEGTLLDINNIEMNDEDIDNEEMEEDRMEEEMEEEVDF